MDSRKNSGPEETPKSQDLITLNIPCYSAESSRIRCLEYYLTFSKARSLPQNLILYTKSIKRQDRTPLLDPNFEIVDAKYLGDSLFLLLVGRVNFVSECILYLYNSKCQTPIEILRVSPNHKYHLVNKDCILRENHNDGSLEIMRAGQDKDTFQEIADGIEIRPGTVPIVIDTNRIVYIAKCYTPLIYVNLAKMDSSGFEFVDLQSNVLAMTYGNNTLYALIDSSIILAVDLQKCRVIKKQQTNIQKPSTAKVSMHKGSLFFQYEKSSTTSDIKENTVRIYHSDLSKFVEHMIPVGPISCFDFRDHIYICSVSSIDNTTLSLYCLDNASQSIYATQASAPILTPVIKLESVDDGVMAFTSLQMIKASIKCKLVIN